MMDKMEKLYKNFNFCKDYISAEKRTRIANFLQYVENATFMSFEEASAIIGKIIAE